MGKPCSCMQFIKFTASHVKIRISTTSHTRIRISTTSHVRILIRYCKSRKEIEGSYDKIVITIVPSYTGKIITCLLPLALLLVLRTRKNTDGNKLMIFSGIAWYYGDNYIVTKCGCYAGHKSIHHAHQISVLAHAIRSQTLVPCMSNYFCQGRNYG